MSGGLNYKECGRAVKQAVRADKWVDIGIFAETEDTQKRPAARYKSFETTVVIFRNVLNQIPPNFSH
jgi:hypothetical protein